MARRGRKRQLDVEAPVPGPVGERDRHRRGVPHSRDRTQDRL